MRIGWMDLGWISAMLVVGACAAEEEGDPSTDPQASIEHHGDVGIELRTAANQDRSPYEGTRFVSVSLDYLDCLVDLYEAEPGLRQDGPVGAEVFEAWAADGCGVEGLDCSIASIAQSFDVSPPRLTVRYEVASNPENREIRFGPLPDAELAGCDPLVRLGRPDAIRGEDAEGTVLWTLVSFDPDKAATDQGQAIEIRAGVQ